MQSYERPDGHFVVRPDGDWSAPEAAQAARLADSTGRTVLAMLPLDSPSVGLLLAQGFVCTRKELVLSGPVSRGLSAVERVDVSSLRHDTRSVEIRRVDEVAIADLHRLDLALRRDVPGSERWASSLEGFVDETFGQGFDERLYLVAEAPEGLIGLVRVWLNDSGPRLGLVGVLPPYRRTRVTAALLSHVLQAAEALGIEAITGEVDVENTDALTLARRLGADVVSTLGVLACGGRTVGEC